MCIALPAILVGKVGYTGKERLELKTNADVSTSNAMKERVIQSMCNESTKRVTSKKKGKEDA